MKKSLVALLLGASLVAAAPSAMAEPTPARADATTLLFAAGGTQVSNAIFFPGTVLCAGAYCYGVPLMVPQGNDIQFINLDPVALANFHQIQCYKRNKRTGKPVCQSQAVSGPGQTNMLTSHLKPGIYEFTCTVHYGMRGSFEITQ